MAERDCPHPNLRAEVDVNRFEDTGKFMADVRILACSIDELELRAPIEPQGEARLQTRAVFQMPELPRKH